MHPMHTSNITPTLSGWTTITAVSESLGINHATVRQAVHRALLDRQEWVKREPYPTSDDSVRWLINTSDAMYQCHARRWQNRARKTDIAQAMARSEAHDTCSPDVLPQGSEGTAAWAALCHWLAQQGLVVYVNALAADQNWQWCWMDCAGSGYTTAEDAIIAALQRCLPENAPLMSAKSEPLAEASLPLWKRLCHLCSTY